MNPITLIETKIVLQGIAELMWSFYRDLIEQGFTEDQALDIAIAWHTTISRTSPEDDE